MVDAVTRIARLWRLLWRRLAAALALAALGATAAAAGLADGPPASAPPVRQAGETLPDPMRPSGMAPVPAAVAAARTASSPSAARPARLQSVLLGHGGARAAVIDGVVLAVGDRLGTTRLLSVDERSAVLVGPQGQTTTLLLIPGVNRQDAATLSPTASTPQPEPVRRPASLRVRRATETPS